MHCFCGLAFKPESVTCHVFPQASRVVQLSLLLVLGSSLVLGGKGRETFHPERRRETPTVSRRPPLQAPKGHGNGRLAFPRGSHSRRTLGSEATPVWREGSPAPVSLAL